MERTHTSFAFRTRNRELGRSSHSSAYIQSKRSVLIPLFRGRALASKCLAMCKVHDHRTACCYEMIVTWIHRSGNSTKCLVDVMRSLQRSIQKNGAQTLKSFEG